MHRLPGPLAFAAVLGIVAVVVLVVRSMGRAGVLFEIVHRPGRRPSTRFRGAVPQAKHPAIREFFGHDLRPARPVQVRAKRAAPGDPLRIDIRGIDGFGAQRVRNFLSALLD